MQVILTEQEYDELKNAKDNAEFAARDQFKTLLTNRFDEVLRELRPVLLDTFHDMRNIMHSDPDCMRDRYLKRVDEVLKKAQRE